jgi:hypothetical protein
LLSHPRFGGSGIGGIGTDATRDVPFAFTGRAAAFVALGLEFLVIGEFAMGAEESLAEVGLDASFLGGDEATDANEGDGFEEAVNVLGRVQGAGGLG